MTPKEIIESLTMDQYRMIAATIETVRKRSKIVGFIWGGLAVAAGFVWRDLIKNVDISCKITKTDDKPKN